MESIAYWEASGFLLDPYTAKLLIIENPIYSATDHWQQINKSAIIERMFLIAHAIFHHIRALFSSSYKQDFLRRAHLVNNAFINAEVPKSVEQEPSLLLRGIVEKNMSKSFAEVWELLFKKEKLESVNSIIGVAIHLKSPIKLKVTAQDSNLAEDKIVLIFGAEKEKATNYVKFYFKKETVSKKDKPKEMDEAGFATLIGKPITRMVFTSGAQSYVHTTKSWPADYLYPQLTEISIIDDNHVLIRSSLNLTLFDWNEEPRVVSVEKLKENWERGVEVTDETTELKGAK